MLISLTFWLSSVFYREYVYISKACKFFTPGCLVEISRALKPHLLNDAGCLSSRCLKNLLEMYPVIVTHLTVVSVSRHIRF